MKDRLWPYSVFQLTLLNLRSWFFRSFISKHYASARLGWCFLSHLAQSFCIYISCQTVLTSYTESISHDRQTPGLYRIRLASIEPAVLAIRQELFTRRSTDLYCVYRFYRLYSMQSQLIIVQATSLRIKLAQNQKPSPDVRVSSIHLQCDKVLSRHKCKQCAKNKDIEPPCLHSVTFFELTSVNSVSLASWQWHRGKDMAQDRSVSSQVQTLRCTKDSTDTSCVMTALRLDCDWFVNILAKIPTSSGMGRYESCFLFWAVWEAFNSLQSLPMLTPPMSWVFLHHPSPLFIPPSWHEGKRYPKLSQGCADFFTVWFRFILDHFVSYTSYT